MNNNIGLIGYIKASNYRIELLKKLIEKPSTPTELANLTKINKGHVSRALKELCGKKLVECGNEEAKKGRMYLITELGKKIIKEL